MLHHTFQPIASSYRLRLLIGSVISCLAASSVYAEPSETSQPAADIAPLQAGIAPVQADIAPAQIERWVAQLDDDRFDTRQLAQQQLERTGKPAIVAVAAVAKSGSLESATRAINILLQWSEAQQQELRLAALEKLANLPNRPRESAMATRLLANAREHAALEALSGFGAQYVGDRHTHGIGNLQVVIGPKWTGGYEGLKHLADVPRVSTISFYAAPLDDPALDYLAQLPNVLRIEIYGTKLSPAAVEKFKKQAPRVDLDFRVGALLGVHGDIFQGRISQVEPNSAADKAGIVPGDRITEFNGEKVVDFKALTDRIRHHQAGDTATLTVLRKDKSRQVKVTFGDWAKADITKKMPRRQLPIQRQRIVPPAKSQLERR